MNRKTLLVLFITLSLFNCCKDKDDKCMDPKNPDCSNYNPCYDQHEVTADFWIHETHWTYTERWVPYDTDTLWSVNASFVAVEKQATEYTWLIGSEVLHDRVVERNSFPIGQPIPITLIVKREPNKLCFPNDDGIDTVTRTMLVIDAEKYNMLIEGTFRGANTDTPNDSFNVTINLRDTAASSVGNPLKTIEGLPNDCGKVIYNLTVGVGYKQFEFWDNGGSDCYYPRGLAKVEGNKITIDYNISTGKTSANYYDRINKQFKGIRIK